MARLSLLAPASCIAKRCEEPWDHLLGWSSPSSWFSLGDFLGSSLRWRGQMGLPCAVSSPGKAAPTGNMPAMQECRGYLFV